VFLQMCRLLKEISRATARPWHWLAKAELFRLSRPLVNLPEKASGSIDPCHLMMGVPGSMLEAIYTHILDMAKPIAMLKKARAGA
jgi:hypothetical protein